MQASINEVIYNLLISNATLISYFKSQVDAEKIRIYRTSPPAEVNRDDPHAFLMYSVISITPTGLHSEGLGNTFSGVLNIAIASFQGTFKHTSQAGKACLDIFNGIRQTRYSATADDGITHQVQISKCDFTDITEEDQFLKEGSSEFVRLNTLLFDISWRQIEP